MMYNPLKHNIIWFSYSTLTHKTRRRTKPRYQLIRVSVFHIRPIFLSLSHQATTLDRWISLPNSLDRRISPANPHLRYHLLNLIGIFGLLFDLDLLNFRVFSPAMTLDRWFFLSNPHLRVSFSGDNPRDRWISPAFSHLRYHLINLIGIFGLWTKTIKKLLLYCMISTTMMPETQNSVNFFQSLHRSLMLLLVIFSIITNRKVVDFTQPYIESS
ncbi:hypothetical protein HanRHA438_Chr09g0401051 [Helianthus annuus]|nr:hypothetical protein HanRHA438_Chr09g0401051 [Helianthus annuus]